MSESLSQKEAERLISMRKRRIDDTVWPYPRFGGSISIEIESEDREERFLLDIHCGRIELSKVTYQERYVVDPLVRLDIDGPDHMNPDGEIVPCPHLHIYREGFGARWASAVSEGDFTDVSDRGKTLQEFFSYCSIVEPPIIPVPLF